MKSSGIVFLLTLLLSSPLPHASQLPKQDAADSSAPILQPGEAPTDLKQFVRLKLDEKKRPIAMQVAVVRMVPRDQHLPLQYVDLISAVHIGEHAYYQTINALFPHYDAVLYELVAPEGTRIPRGGGKGRKGIISGLQSWMRDVLGMGMQLEDVDYSAPNLVHADLSPEDFSQSMEKRNESVAGMMGKAWIAGMGQQYSSKAILSEVRLLRNLLSGNRDLALKIFMAEQMVQSIRLGEAVEGSEGSTLVAERNKKALKILRQEMAGSKQKLAIFYGAAHMPDMARRLVSELDMVPAWTGWIDAWDLKR